MRAREAYRQEKEAHRRTCEEMQLLKVQVAKMQQIMSRLGICYDGDGGGEGPQCMVEGEGARMGPPLNKYSAQVKDDIVRAMEGSEEQMCDGRLKHKARATCEREEFNSEMVGEGAATHVHIGGHIGRCSRHCGLTVQEVVRRSATPQRRAYAARRRLSTIAIRMKRQPRTRKASALKGSPYTNPLLPRKKGKASQKKSVTLRGENNSKDTQQAIDGDNQQPVEDGTQHDADDDLQQSARSVPPMEGIQGDGSEVLSDEVRLQL